MHYSVSAKPVSMHLPLTRYLLILLMYVFTEFWCIYVYCSVRNFTVITVPQFKYCVYTIVFTVFTAGFLRRSASTSTNTTSRWPPLTSSTSPRGPRWWNSLSRCSGRLYSFRRYSGKFNDFLKGGDSIYDARSHNFVTSFSLSGKDIHSLSA